MVVLVLAADFDAAEIGHVVVGLAENDVLNVDVDDLIDADDQVVFVELIDYEADIVDDLVDDVVAGEWLTLRL